MTTTGDVTPIKVSGPAGLLAAVPPMLGFHPTNSLVLMCLSGDRRRVGPVARVDLPLGHDRAMARHLTTHAVNHADEVVVISYQDFRRRPPLLDDLLGELAGAGVPVMDAIVVRGGRARPALSGAVERVHPGIPVPDADDPQVAALTAAGAMAGRSVLANREQLRRSIAGPTGKRLRTTERAVDDVLAGRIRSATAASAGGKWTQRDGSALPNSVRQGKSGEHSADVRPEESEMAFGDGPDSAFHAVRIESVPDDANELIARGFAQVDATGTVEVQVAIGLAVHLNDDQVRDAVLARAIVELDRPWLPTLIACATWTPDFLAAPLCSVLSMVAYRHGDGALAQLAVDRCLVAEPKHRLARLMIAIMSAGVRPVELERIANGEDVDYLEHLLCEDYPDDVDYLDEDRVYQDHHDEEAAEKWWGR